MRRLTILLMFNLLVACSDQPTQNRYDSHDVGMNALVFFGTVLSERQVQVTGEDTGTGALTGGVGGGVAGSLIGSGSGSVLGALAGAAAGMFAGNAVEQNMGNRTGLEYIIAVDGGTTQSIVQNIGKDDRPIAIGERVMIQMNGRYRRVLPADAAVQQQTLPPQPPVSSGR